MLGSLTCDLATQSIMVVMILLLYGIQTPLSPRIGTANRRRSRRVRIAYPTRADIVRLDVTLGGYRGLGGNHGANNDDA
jgi:hypothetical protein